MVYGISDSNEDMQLLSVTPSDTHVRGGMFIFMVYGNSLLL